MGGLRWHETTIIPHFNDMSGAVVTLDKEAEVYGSWYVFKTDLKIPVGDAGLKLLPRALHRVFLLWSKDAPDSFTTDCLGCLVIRVRHKASFLQVMQASVVFLHVCNYRRASFKFSSSRTPSRSFWSLYSAPSILQQCFWSARREIYEFPIADLKCLKRTWKQAPSATDPDPFSTPIM